MIKQKNKSNSLIAGYDPYADCGDCVYDADAGQAAVDFFETHLVLIEGVKANKPFVLERWQSDIVRNLFGWKRLDGTRRYRECFIEVARKNGKTPLCAGIINYVAFCDNEPGAQIYSTAGEVQQAALVFRHAAGMISRNPELAKRSRIYRTYKSIEFYGGDTIFKALSADADTKHGLNAHLVINDELHVQPNRDLIDTLETATASRTQPLIIHITTAGFDKNTICHEKYDYACKVRDGIIKDPYFFPVIYETSAEDSWTDEKVWHKANPNLGVSVSIDYLREKCKEAQEIPAKENTFRRLHLNQWTEQDSRWLSMESWNDCNHDFKESDLKGKICFGGLDLSTTTDLSAFVLYFPESGHVLCYPFAPRNGAEKRSKHDKAPYIDWNKKGFITLTDGDVIDYDVIRSTINRLREQFNIKGIAVDRWNATQIITQLNGDGFDVYSMGQGFVSMTSPTKELEKLILSKKLKHNAHPALDWCISNISVEQDAAGNIKPSKKKSTDRIDCAVAMIDAIACSLAKPVTESIYETRGILVI